jgi:hypothetical protein
MGKSEATEIFEHYKSLYPNSIGTFSLDASKIALWQWGIKQHGLRAKGVEIDTTPAPSAVALMERRRVNAFGELPEFTKRVYLCAADFFPDVQIYASGSRVNGDYIDPDSDSVILEMRKALGKAEKQTSDFDFTFHDHKSRLNQIEQCKIFIHQQFQVSADVCPFALVEHKVKIPMWDFDKLTDEQKKQARALFLEKRWGALMKLHNDWKLSPNQYCCSEAPIVRWFTWAFENGKI